MQQKTLSNCFRHADFRRPEPTTKVSETTYATDDDTEDDIPLARLAQVDLTTATLQDYIDIEDSLPT